MRMKRHPYKTEHESLEGMRILKVKISPENRDNLVQRQHFRDPDTSKMEAWVIHLLYCNQYFQELILQH